MDTAESSVFRPSGASEDHHPHACTDGIAYPLTPVESNAAGSGLSTTVLEGVALDELLLHEPRYLNVHVAGSGDPPQLAWAELGEVR